jgi:hypothetical protein
MDFISLIMPVEVAMQFSFFRLAPFFGVHVLICLLHLNTRPMMGASMNTVMNRTLSPVTFLPPSWQWVLKSR